MEQGTVPVTALTSTKEMVFASTGLLKVALIAVFDGTSTLPNAGFVAAISGGVLSGGASGPFLPQAIIKHSRRKTTLAMVDNLFMALTSKNLFYFHDDPAIVVIVERGTNIR
jgi:hypothetical protein